MFIRIVRRSAIVTALLLLACAGAAAALLTWPQAAAAGISRGLSICSTIIIPSLFPFLVLAGFLVKSGLSAAIGRRLEKPTRRLFGLPGCCAAGILVGLIGGYPSGAIAVGELVGQGAITQQQGRRMLLFCVNGGPAFIISAVGVGMLGSVRAGVILYIAHIAASLLLGFLYSLGVPAAERRAPAGAGTQKKPAAKLPPATAFVQSVTGACRSLLVMCGFILLFAAVLSIVDGSGAAAAAGGVARRLLGGRPPAALEAILGAWFPGLLEVSCGSIEAAAAGSLAPLLLGMVLGWGGLSVHCQIAATLNEHKLVGRSFFAARLFHGLIGGVLSMLLLRYIPTAVSAFNPSADAAGVSRILPFATSAATSAALLFMCGLFLLTVDRHENNRRLY